MKHVATITKRPSHAMTTEQILTIVATALSAAAGLIAAITPLVVKE